MYYIYIIDDERASSNLIRQMIQECSLSAPEFSSAQIVQIKEDFLREIDKIPKGSSYENIYIIDINLDETIDGLKVAKQIREVDIFGYIIFVTSHLEWVTMSYNQNIKALNYIYKGDPNLKSNFCESLKRIVFENKAINEHQVDMNNEKLESKGVFRFRYQKNWYQLNINDIYSIETHGRERSIIINAAGGEYRASLTLKKILEELPKTFIRCHKSFIINVNQVESITQVQGAYSAQFVNGRTCLISKKYYNTIIESFRNGREK